MKIGKRKMPKAVRQLVSSMRIEAGLAKEFVVMSDLPNRQIIFWFET
jgi:hypothetical protein